MNPFRISPTRQFLSGMYSGIQNELPLLLHLKTSSLKSGIFQLCIHNFKPGWTIARRSYWLANLGLVIRSIAFPLHSGEFDAFSITPHSKCHSTAPEIQ
jgi:hypothetical protein